MAEKQTQASQETKPAKPTVEMLDTDTLFYKQRVHRFMEKLKITARAAIQIYAVAVGALVLLAVALGALKAIMLIWYFQ